MAAYTVGLVNWVWQPKFISKYMLETKHKRPIRGYADSDSRKRGLVASLIRTLDITIEGISNSSSLWFYSIQGLFRATFEYLDVETQTCCLQNFTNFWLSSANHTLLPESLYLTGVVSSPIIDTDQVLELNQIVNTQDVSMDVLVEAHISDIDSASYEHHIATPQAPEVQNLSSDFEVMFDTIEVPIESNNAMFNEHCIAADHGQLYQDICYGIRAINNVTTAQQLSEKLCCLLKFFYMECLSDNEQCDSPVFPFHILERYTHLISQDIVHQTNCSVTDSFDVEGRHGILLGLICDWVGSEFAQLRCDIAKRVDEFKVHNIGRIDCLPSARHTVDFIFPQCMVLLILRWMDNYTTNISEARSDRRQLASSHLENSVVDVVNEDHSYITDNSRDHLYAFVQLILEFANGCLVSGITHVLYPRLLQAQL